MYTLRTGMGPVGSLLQPMGEGLEVDLKVLAVVPPRLAVDAGRGFSLQAEVSRAQRFRGVVEVVLHPKLRTHLLQECIDRHSSRACLLWIEPYIVNTYPNRN